MRLVDADELKRGIEALCKDERASISAATYFALMAFINKMPTIEAETVKLRTYESEKKAEEEIKVGDEVKDCEAEIGIVFDRKDNKYLVVYFDLAESDIYSGESERGELKKTGRHFPQVAELLAALGGADDEQTT